MITYQKFIDSKFKRYFFQDNQCYTENLKVSDTIEGHKGCVNTIEWDKTGTRILSGGDDAILRIHQYMGDGDKPWVKNDVFHVSLPRSRNILSAKFMPIYNHKIVSASKCGSIFLIDVNKADNTDIEVYFKHTGPVLNISTIPQEPNNFISVSNDKTACIFDIRQSSKPTIQMFFPCSLAAVAAHPIKTNMFASGGSDSFVRVFDRRFLNNCPDVETTLKNVIELCRPLEFPLDIKSNNNGALKGYGRRYVNNITYEPNNGRYMLVNYMYDQIYLFDTKHQEDKEQHIIKAEEPTNSTNTFHVQYNWDNTGPQSREGNHNSEFLCPPSVQSFINDLQQKELGLNDETVSSENAFKAQLNSTLRYKQVQMYRGHLNCRTMIKDSRFWGTNYILSGSECGNILVWERFDKSPVAAIQTDKHVANRIEPHPYLPIIASSGIDYDIKIVSSNLIPDKNDFGIKAQMRVRAIVNENKHRDEKAKNSQSISMMDLLRIMRAQRLIQRLNGTSSSDA